MKQKQNAPAGSRTMLLSVLMSAPGPLIMGLGLLAGSSSTQLADFVRRSAELLGLVMSLVTYRRTAGRGLDPAEIAKAERRSNRFVGAMMCLGGSIMLALALLSEGGDKGNVIPALAISLSGVIANTIFWRRYAGLYKKEQNPIIGVQSRLYRAKSLVDTAVTIALLAVVIAPASPASHVLDTAGSAIVALYLMGCGIRTVGDTLQKKSTPT